ncbi:hypothetical protein F5Y16DRAFT_375795 [Xylariaceae sp. FL0255]|nr:hypothetical protein F5Y16DRAFT_375795 [Xylariaceae sp. FL0255]
MPSNSSSPLLLISQQQVAGIGPAGLGVGIALALSTTAVVPLRFWAKRLTKVKFWIDDYLILAALIFHHGFAITSALAVFVGGTKSSDQSQSAEDAAVLNDTIFLYKSIYAGQILYGLSSPLVKLAILAFLWRTFPTPHVRISCIILSSLSIAWIFPAQILNFVECRPIQAFWEVELRNDPGTHCINFVEYDFGLGITNALIDLATITIPIHEILKLNISTSKKIGVCAIFLIGGITFAASLLRAITLALVLSEGKSMYTTTYLISGLATVIEIYTAIIGACVPLLVPVYRKLRYGDLYCGTQTRPSEKSKASTGASISHNDPIDAGRGSLNRHGDRDVLPLVHMTGNHREVGVRAEESEDDTELSAQGIRVRQDFQWHSQPTDAISV